MRLVLPALLLLTAASAALAPGDPTCDDLSGIDFGECATVLGVGVIDGECVSISGCESPVPLFPDLASCILACEPSCEDLSGIDFGPCDAVLGFGIIDGDCTEISGCESPVPLFPTEADCIAACSPIPVERGSWGVLKVRFE